MRVVTWNTLHRVHALNWGESAVARHPDERERAAAIAAAVAGWLASGADVVCLQEVSGDLLAVLRSIDGATVVDHVYPRVPGVRGAKPAELVDPSEHLAVVVRAAGARVVKALTFDSDPGKGLLAVEVGGVTIVDTHVSYGGRSAAQLAVLGDLGRAAKRAAIVGDFNAPADAVRAGLGPGFALAELVGPTRIAEGASAGKTIDHVAVVGGAVRSAKVLDAEGLSDHHPVVADVDFAPARPG